MGAVNNVTNAISSALGTDGSGGGVIGGVSDTVSHVGQVVSNSPLAQAVISGGAAVLTGGASIPYTAGLLAANSVGQGQSLGQAALTGLGSYAVGSGVNNYMATGSVFGQGGLSGVFGNGSTTNPGGIFTGAGADGVMTNAEALSYGLTGGDVTGIGSGLLSGLNGAYNAVTGGVGGALQNGANAINGLMGGGTGAGGTSGSFDMGRMIQMGAGLAGSYLNNQAAADAATKQADAQIRAAQIAADAAKFRPVGVTTNFGSSNFGYDTNGNLTSAGYNLDPRLKAQQDQLMQHSGGLMNQYTNAQAATSPMGQAAQRAMTLGNQYLATDPQAQAAKYLADQTGLLAPGRAQDLAGLQAQMNAQGRTGFAMGGGVNGQMAANPEMQAYWNARMQQDAQLAANATQGGMDYAKFGLGTVGSGGDMLSGMYRTQAGAEQPYQTALGVAQGIEGMGQQALTMGMDMGSATTAASAAAGRLQGQGMMNAADTMAPVNAYSPWGSLLSGGSDMMQQYKFGA